jgi:uncharacterized protein (DUF2141 family)
MKKIGILIISALVAVFCITAMSHAGTIIVEVTGIKQNSGNIAISLFNGADTFPTHGKGYKSASIPVTGNEVVYTFSDIPSGEYALAIYHDVNGNKEFDRNVLGIPQEDYAFSNNASSPFGPPRFEKAKFMLDDTYTAHITLQ